MSLKSSFHTPKRGVDGGKQLPAQEESSPSPPDSEICLFRAYQFLFVFPVLPLYNFAKHRMYALGWSVDETAKKHDVKKYLHPIRTKNIVCPAQATIQWLFQACWGHAITVGWLINVDGYVQPAKKLSSVRNADCVNIVSNFAHCWDCIFGRQ